MNLSTAITESQHFAGLIAIFITITFLIVPAIKLGIKPHEKTISHTIKSHPEIEFVLRVALIIGAFFQTWFLGYLLQRFSLPLFAPGPILYIGLGLSTIGAAVWTTSTSPRTHYYFSLYYFFTAPLMLLFIGLSIGDMVPIARPASIVCVVIYCLGQTYLFFRYRTNGNGLMQYLGFGVLAVWTMIMTFL